MQQTPDELSEFDKIKADQIDDIIRQLKHITRLDKDKPKKFKFYCPLCRTERRIPYFPDPSLKHYLQLAFFTLIVVIFFYPVFGMKGVFLLIPFWAVFEVIYRLKKREAMVCTYCGFDFYLYKRDVNLAKQRVREFWERKKTEKNPTKDEKKEPSEEPALKDKT